MNKYAPCVLIQFVDLSFMLTENKPAQPLYKALFFILILAIIIFRLPASSALALGLAMGLTVGNPFQKSSRKVMKYLLQASVIGLGFAMNISKVMEAGKDGFVYTLMTISAAMGLGYLLGRLFKVERIISYLVSVGTAICGGSAIAAVSQVLQADDNDISVSIGTVFILNAIALFIFPVLGTYFHLTQQQFGIWSAIAIHDTSSVVGAASHYGDEALQIATTIKLARALWIIPLVILTSIAFKRQGSPWSLPWFILFFLLASVANSYLKLPEVIVSGLVDAAKRGFSLTLFLIGSGISITAIKKVGARPMLQGVTLWIIVLVTSLYFLKH
jgi:uncharacterized integral membrane protein (TIGR00698 family)